MKIFFLNILILLLLSSNDTTSQVLVPPIQNYSSADYDAASQNWDITLDDMGILYAANNEGLLSYDGQQWELFPLKTGSIIRSAYAHNNRIYTGSYQEFGYWTRDNTGEMSYTSLMPLLGDYSMQSEEFWEILSFEEAIYFRSFGAIYKYENEKIEPVKNMISSEMVVFNNRLLIAAGRQGLFYLEENGDLEYLPNQEVIEGKSVVDIEVDGKNLLIGTKDALYVFDGEIFQIYNKRLNEQLERFELNRILKISEEELVIGTTKNGILHHNKRTGKTQIYNRNNGLQNNTVLAMAFRNGKIWLGLDNGIDEIHLNSPIEFFTDDTGELGAVYDLAFFEDALYMASNTGVYRLNDTGMQIVEGSGGHCWNLEVLNNVLYSNHNAGTFKVIDEKFVQVDNRTGSFQILKSPGSEDSYFIANYTGISAYNTSSDQIVEIDDIAFPVKKIVFENPSTLWAAHPYEGVYRIGLNQDNKNNSIIEKIGETKGEGNYKPSIFEINNQIAILKNQVWYKYNSFQDTLELFEELQNFNYHKLLLEEREGYWFTNTISNSLLYTNFRDKNINVAFGELNRRLVKNHESLIKLNDSLYFVTLNDGFARINLNKLIKAKQKEYLSKPILKGLLDAQRRYDLTITPSIPYKHSQDITILTALPVSDASSLNYELIGENRLEGEVKNGILKFQNLSHGDYKLNLFALSPQAMTSEITSFTFSINPPWYLSNLMKIAYILIFIGLIGFVYWFNKLKLNKHQWLLEQKFEKEHQERLNDLEKERLMNEITIKRKELANTTMIAAKKNEVLMEIQGELNKDKDKFSNQFRLKHIMNKINQAVKSKDEWKVFETNFNEVHEDFFKMLLDKYPHLSNKDLKLSSYLKMNLSSKEIAPLMGISVRGVEVHRYRLRKKMELDSNENLNNFLIKNF